MFFVKKTEVLQEAFRSGDRNGDGLMSLAEFQDLAIPSGRLLQKSFTFSFFLGGSFLWVLV